MVKKFKTFQDPDLDRQLREMVDAINNGGTGAATFIGLTDTPAAYTGQAGKAAVVNAGETAIEFVSVSGTGDMTKAVYDPTAKNTDAFNVDNHASGTTNKVYTATEKTKLAAITGANTGDQNLSSYAQVAGQLGGTSASPDVRGIRETAGPTLLTLGAVADGQFLRRSGSTVIGAAPGAGSFVATQVEVDFGATAVEGKEFTITDAACTASSKIVASMAYVDTDDNSADEIEMSGVFCNAGLPGTGSFTMYVGANDGPISGKLRANYALG